MKKIYLCSVLLLVIISGCFKDDCKSVHRLYKPVFKPLSNVRAEMIGGAAQPIHATGKIYLYNNYILINEPGKGIHVIDNSNPSSPQNISFINIPGNYDLAVKNNYLYADSYSDFIVFDISNAKHAVVKEFKNNVFPQQNRFYYNSTSTNPDSVMVAVDFKEVDTTVDCNVYDNWTNCSNCAITPDVMYLSAPKASPGPNVGGSTARFAVLNNYLYTVDNSSLYSFNLNDVSDPLLENTTGVGWTIETIFPFENKLFIGSEFGIYIYDVSTPNSPQSIGQFGHIPVCDPVITDGKNAFVTLNSSTTCWNVTTNVNELDILDITSDITNPSLIKTYSMTAPKGLCKINNLLFICDGTNGLKVFDATDVNNLQLKQQLRDTEPNDVITYNNIAYVSANNGLYEYDYSDENNITLLSKINIQ